MKTMLNGKPANINNNNKTTLSKKWSTCNVQQILRHELFVFIVNFFPHQNFHSIIIIIIT